MCGRYAQYGPISRPSRYCGVAEDHILADEAPPRYNIAPSSDVLVVRLGDDGERELVRLKWGLVPSWAKEPETGYSMINARAETVDTKPAFRAAFHRRRCLIPADGWYEWQPIPGQRWKQPWYFRLKSEEPLAFAGLWEHWQQGPQSLQTCTIIVCEANALAAPIHDRMPVILEPQDFAAWLDPKAPADQARALLKPAPVETLRAYKVSRAVNSTAHDGPQLIEAQPD